MRRAIFLFRANIPCSDDRKVIPSFSDIHLSFPRLMLWWTGAFFLWRKLSCFTMCTVNPQGMFYDFAFVCECVVRSGGGSTRHLNFYYFFIYMYIVTSVFLSSDTNDSSRIHPCHFTRMFSLIKKWWAPSSSDCQEIMFNIKTLSLRVFRSEFVRFDTTTKTLLQLNALKGKGEGKRR